MVEKEGVRKVVFEVVPTQTTPAIKVGDSYVSVEEFLVLLYEKLDALERVVIG